MDRHSIRSLADCTTKEDAVTFLEIASVHTKDTVLAGLVKTWKHLTGNTSDAHTVRTYGPIRATRRGLRERQICSRINERLMQVHPSIGTLSLPEAE